MLVSNEFKDNLELILVNLDDRDLASFALTKKSLNDKVWEYFLKTLPPWNAIKNLGKEGIIPIFKKTITVFYKIEIVKEKLTLVKTVSTIFFIRTICNFTLNCKNNIHFNEFIKSLFVRNVPLQFIEFLDQHQLLVSEAINIHLLNDIVGSTNSFELISYLIEEKKIKATIDTLNSALCNRTLNYIDKNNVLNLVANSNRT